MSRLTADRVGEILDALATSNDTFDELAARFGVSRGMIGHINTGLGWRWVEQDRPRPVRDRGARAKAILAALARGEDVDAIAAHYGVSPKHVKNINAGRAWGWVEGSPRPVVNVPPQPSPRRKLTAEQVRAIRAAGARGQRQVDIAARLGIRQNNVSAIMRGTYYADVDGPRTHRGRSKLSPDEVRAVRSALLAGETPAAIAARFGVCGATVRLIATGCTWGWLDDE